MSKNQRSKIELLIDKYIAEAPGASTNMIDVAPVSDIAAGKFQRTKKAPKPKAMPKKMGRPAKVRKPTSWNTFVKEYHAKHKDKSFKENMTAASLEWKSVKGGMLATAPLAGPIVGADRPLSGVDQNLSPEIPFTEATIKPRGGARKRKALNLAESNPNNQETTLPSEPATIYTALPSENIVKRQMKIAVKKADANPSKSILAGCLCDYASTKIGQKLSEDDILDMIRTDPKIGGILIGGFLKANHMQAEPKEIAPKPKKAMNSYFVALKQWNAKKGGKWVVPKKNTPEYNEVMAMKA